MSKPVPLIAGNWKMNGLASALTEVRALKEALAQTPARGRVAICPPATLLCRLSAETRGSPVETGGQDSHADDCGAFTGDISAEMLKDAGATLVILGHSERRDYHRESDADVACKVGGAIRAGLEPIVCVGETRAEREAGRALEVVESQVRGSVPEALSGRPFSVAYEPVWAIGTGLTPTIEQIEEVHRAIRAVLVERFGEEGARVPILYGGSVKPANAAEILKADEVGGALVGGASLKASDFLAIVRAL